MLGINAYTKTSDFTICALYMFKDNCRDSNPDDETMHSLERYHHALHTSFLVLIGSSL